MTSAVQVQYDYPDGGSLTVTVQADASYPDHLSQARSEAVRALVDTINGITPAEEDT